MNKLFKMAFCALALAQAGQVAAMAPLAVNNSEVHYKEVRPYVRVGYAVINNRIEYVHPDAPHLPLPHGLFYLENTDAIRTPMTQRRPALLVQNSKVNTNRPFVWSVSKRGYGAWQAVSGGQVNWIPYNSLGKYQDPSRELHAWREENNRRLRRLSAFSRRLNEAEEAEQTDPVALAPIAGPSAPAPVASVQTAGPSAPAVVQEEESVCPICLETGDNEHGRFLPLSCCRGLIHERCFAESLEPQVINQWGQMTRGNQCPLCRAVGPQLN